MIWHFFEVWGLLLVAFAAGCLLGTLLYMAIAVSPLAGAQVAAADSIVDALNGLRPSDFRGREAAAYRPPVREEPYAPLAPLPVEQDHVALVAPEALELDPVDVAAGEVDAAIAPLESEWDEDPYWDGESEDYPATEALPPALPPDHPSPEVLPQAERETRQELPAIRPLTLPGPRNGVPDNLQKIRGIGQKNEELLNSLGVFHFGQIAAWTPAEARWIASHLAFPERVERDDWVGQAIILATGGETGYVKAADRRKGSEEPPVTPQT